jgi:hypothetical protein
MRILSSIPSLLTLALLVLVSVCAGLTTGCIPKKTSATQQRPAPIETINVSAQPASAPVESTVEDISKEVIIPEESVTEPTDDVSAEPLQELPVETDNVSDLAESESVIEEVSDKDETAVEQEIEAVTNTAEAPPAIEAPASQPVVTETKPEIAVTIETLDPDNLLADKSLFETVPEGYDDISTETLREQYLANHPVEENTTPTKPEVTTDDSVTSPSLDTSEEESGQPMELHSQLPTTGIQEAPGDMAESLIEATDVETDLSGLVELPDAETEATEVTEAVQPTSVPTDDVQTETEPAANVATETVAEAIAATAAPEQEATSAQPKPLEFPLALQFMQPVPEIDLGAALKGEIDGGGKITLTISVPESNSADALLMISWQGIGQIQSEVIGIERGASKEIVLPSLSPGAPPFVRVRSLGAMPQPTDSLTLESISTE